MLYCGWISATIVLHEHIVRAAIEHLQPLVAEKLFRSCSDFGFLGADQTVIAFVLRLTEVPGQFTAEVLGLIGCTAVEFFCRLRPGP